MRTLGWNIALIVALFAIVWICKATYQITEDRARPKIEELLGTTEFTIIDQSNNNIIVGSPGDVTYNIRLHATQEVVSCRCTDGLWQPLICRKYQ